MGDPIDITGKRFGMLTAVRPVGNKNGVQWLCKCDCGKTCVRSVSHARRAVSCGCTRSPRPHLQKDITNQRFGSLVAIRSIGRDSRGERLWFCQCDCGNEHTVKLGHLVDGGTQSCGCRGGNYKHGYTNHPLYGAWYDMMTRCYNPDNPSYKWYGARGIGVCKRWHDVANYILDAGERPYPKATFDRIDNNGHYEPNNMHWASMKEQAANRRPYPKNRKRIKRPWNSRPRKK